MRVFLLIACLLASVSCTDAVVDDRAAPALSAGGSLARPLGRLITPDAERYRGASESARAARLELMDVVMERYGKIRTILESQEVDATRRQSVWDQLAREDQGGAESWFVEQMAATVMLESMMSSVPTSDRIHRALRWDAISAARSINLLLQHGNPNAPLMASALVRMKGYWDDDRIADAASSAIRSARAWLEQECGACTGSRKVDGETAEFGRVDILQVMTGIEDLEVLAGGR